MRAPGSKRDFHGGLFRAVGLSVTTLNRRPPPPIDLSHPRALHFRIRLAGDPPIQPKGFLKLLSNALGVLKVTPKLRPIAAVLERALKRFPRVAYSLGTAIPAAKRIKYLLSVLGVALAYVEILDDQTRRGQSFRDRIGETGD